MEMWQLRRFVVLAFESIREELKDEGYENNEKNCAYRNIRST